jgi:hypothetical protein
MRPLLSAPPTTTDLEQPNLSDVSADGDTPRAGLTTNHPRARPAYRSSATTVDPSGP